MREVRLDLTHFEEKVSLHRYLKETQGQQDWQPQQKPDVPEQAAPPLPEKRKVNYDPEQFE